MANLNFAVAINLLTDSFNRGRAQITSGLRNIQMQAMAMFAAFSAGGIGLTDFVSKMAEVARETNKVNTALKNVSGNAWQLANNQKFLIELSQKYGLYINDLTNNYAKFTAAANISGMTMQAQRSVFESLSRASVAFGLSADDVNGVFLAITQMMGKGKIQAEELRGQLGERLPIAMQAMAKAAGTSVAGLDNIMKAGKLMSADVLPKFAAALNEMLPNVSTDNLEASLNRLKNKFKEFTDSTGIQNFYKSSVDKLSGLFTWIQNNVQSIANFIISILSGVIITKGIKMLVASYQNLAKEAERSYRRQALAAGQAFDRMAFLANKFSLTMKFALRSAFSSFAPMVIISAITAIIAKVVEWYNKQKEINSIYSNYQKELKNAGSTNDEIVKMQSLLRVMNNKNESQKRINTAQQELMGMLGLEHASQQQINEAVKKRIELIKEAARADLYSRKAVETENKINDLSSGIGLTTTQVQRLVSQYVKAGGKETNDLDYQISKEVRASGNKGEYDLGAIMDTIKTVGQLNRVLNDSNAHLDKSVLNASSLSKSTATPSGKTEEDPIKKAEDDYKTSLKEITNRYKNQNIDLVTYHRLLDELNQKTKDQLSGLLSPDQAKRNSTYQSLLQNKDQYTDQEKAGVDLGNEKDKYNTQLAVLNKQRELGIVAENDYNKKLNDLIDTTIEAVLSIKNIGASGNEFVKALQAAKGTVLKKDDFSLPYKPAVDHTFDYKKSDTEKLEDQKQASDEYVKTLAKKSGSDNIEEQIRAANGDLSALKKQFNGQADALIEELNNALQNADSLDKALKIAQVKQDVKDLQKELNTGTWEGIKGGVSAVSSIYNSFKNLSQTLESNNNAFEKLLSIFDAITNTVDSISKVITTIQTLTELTKRLGQAKQAEQLIDNLVTTQKVTNAGISSGASVTAAATTTAAAGTEVAANTAVAETGAIKSASFLPFPLNLVLMGVALAGVTALLGKVARFENGGIVGGSSYTGDKLLARVNSGELILNKGQQSTLYGMLNSKEASGGSGKVEFVLEGKHLKGVLDNYSKIKSKS